MTDLNRKKTKLVGGPLHGQEVAAGDQDRLPIAFPDGPPTHYELREDGLFHYVQRPDRMEQRSGSKHVIWRDPYGPTNALWEMATLAARDELMSVLSPPTTQVISVDRVPAGELNDMESRFLMELADLIDRYNAKIYYTNDDDGVHYALQDRPACFVGHGPDTDSMRYIAI